MVQKLPLPPRPANARREAAEVESTPALAELTRPAVRESDARRRETAYQMGAAPHLPPAFLAALSLARHPSLAKKYRREALPEGILQLIRLAAGAERKGDVHQATDVSDALSMVPRAMAVFYVEQILWTDPRDPFRVLGLSPGASYYEVTENAHLLMKWLQPYVGSQRREAVFADRVLQARVALTPSYEGADAITSADPQAVIGLSESTPVPKGRSRPGRVATSLRDNGMRWWRIGLAILVAILAIEVAVVGIRLAQRGDDVPPAGGLVSGAAVEGLMRAQP